MIQKQLGQVRAITAGTPVSIYSPPADVEASDLILTLCNQTTNAVNYRVFQDDNGTTYDQTTALHYDVSLPANSTIRLQIGPMSNSSGNLAVDVGTTNAITFTLHGRERQIA